MYYYKLISRFQRNGIITFLECKKEKGRKLLKSEIKGYKQFDIWTDYFKTLEEVNEFKHKFRNIIDLTN